MKTQAYSLIDLTGILVKWKKFILRNFIIVCVIMVIISLVVPRWYRANTILLPPSEDSGGMGLAAALLSNLPVSGFGSGNLGAFSQETNIFLAILNSRSLLSAIVDKFDLKKEYKTETLEEAIKALQDHITMQVNEDGTIAVAAEAGTPFLASEAEVLRAKTLARDMTNAIVTELDIVNKRIKVEQAHNTRIFIEKRYHQNLEDLRAAEEALKLFQQKHEAIALPEQTKAVITAAAEIRAQITAKEIEAEFLAKYLGKTHPDYVKAQNELSILTAKYNQFKYGTNGDKYSTSIWDDERDIFIPIDKVPELGLQFARLYREVMLQEKILEFILPQYEQAKIQEAKDTPTVQVLDRAELPERKSRPKRMIMVAVAGLLAIAFSLGFALIVERVQTLQQTSPEKYRKLQQISRSFISDWRFWKK
ncbi:hypothetical protein JXO59_01235 [candidate division KSB1 bacterium]|nr:hypothetical protein [candidate division KSB1 bacterium]